MKCPCGCGKEVPHLCYWATKKCGERAKKNGIYMPSKGEWRKDTRERRFLKSLRKGMK